MMEWSSALTEDIDAQSVERAHALVENQQLEDGEQVAVGEFDIHEEHEPIHQARMSQPDFNNLPLPVQEAFVMHLRNHGVAKLMKVMQEAQKQQMVQQALAPPAPPGMPQGGPPQATGSGPPTQGP